MNILFTFPHGHQSDQNKCLLDVYVEVISMNLLHFWMLLDEGIFSVATVTWFSACSNVKIIPVPVH